MRDRYSPSAINHQDLECCSARGRRRWDRACLATSGGLAALPILMFFLWINTSHQDGYLRFFAVAGMVSEFHHRTSARGASLRGYPSSPDDTRFSEPNMFPPTSSNAVSKVPLSQDSGKHIGATYYNMQNIFKDGHAKNSASKFKQWVDFSAGHRNKRRRRRRAVTIAGSSAPAPTQPSQPTPAPGHSGVSPHFYKSTIMPDSTTSTKVRYEFHPESTYASTTDPTLTSTATRDQGLTTSGESLPSTGLQSSNTVQASHTPTPPLQTSRPNPSTATPHDTFASSPIPEESVRSARYNANSPEPSEYASMPGATRTSQTMTNEPAASSSPRDSTEESTRMTQPLSSFSLKPSFFTSTTVTMGNAIKTSSDRTPSGHPKVNVKRVRQQQNDEIYTVVTRIHTSPSILIIMPCLVGLALLGLLGAGIKRYVLFRRLGRMVELARDPENAKKDQGYTIENPMVKNRRSYIERQMERTLQKVNGKSESSRSSSRNSSTGKNANSHTKVRMEVAAISDGSLRRSFRSMRRPDGSLRWPVRPLRRVSSERVAPSRAKQSNASFLSSPRGECQCVCHCPLCAREGRPLGNGKVETGIVSTWL